MRWKSFTTRPQFFDKVGGPDNGLHWHIRSKVAVTKSRYSWSSVKSAFAAYQQKFEPVEDSAETRHGNFLFFQQEPLYQMYILQLFETILGLGLCS